VTTGLINKLFLKLQGRYGNQWSSQWIDEGLYKIALQEWYEELKHYTLEDIKRGLDSYRGDFPPNLMQFSNACKKPSTALAHQEYKQIAPITTTKEQAKKNISKLKEAISGTGVII